MAKKKESDSSAERKNWEKTFQFLVEELQLATGKINFYRDRLISAGNLYEEHMSQLEREKTALQMTQNVDRFKLDMIVSLKKRNDTVHKANYDSTLEELKDLKAAFDSDIKVEANTTTQIAALKSENEFVWNQFKTMERDYIGKLKSKNTEIELANGKVMTLLNKMEQLQSLNTEKDSLIKKWKSELDESREKIAEKDSLIKKWKSELDERREKIDLSRKKAGNGSATPSLRGCTVVTSRDKEKKDIVLKLEGNPSGLPEKGSRSSKRQAANISETPKLFSSEFKVPKLKNPSPRSNI